MKLKGRTVQCPHFVTAALATGVGGQVQLSMTFFGLRAKF